MKWILIYKDKEDRAYLLGKYDTADEAREAMRVSVQEYCEKCGIDTIDCCTSMYADVKNRSWSIILL